MSNNTLSFRSNRFEVVPQVFSPMEYSVPYEWGNLHVTEEAHAAYEMIPLTPTKPCDLELMMPGRSRRGSEPRLDLVLAGPSEAKNADEGTTFWSSVYADDNQVIVVAGHTKDKAAMISTTKQNILDGYRQFFGSESVPDEEILDTVGVVDGVSINEALDNNVSQAFAHEFADIFDSVVRTTLEHSRNFSDNMQFLRNAATIGFVTIAGISPVISLGYEVSESLPTLAPSIFTAITVGGLLLSTKKYIHSQHERTILNTQIANAKAELVSGSIHDTYCDAHFDNQFEEIFSR